MQDNATEWLVESSFIKRIRYEPRHFEQWPHNFLIVELITGVTYEYSGVPEQTVMELVAADSIGSYFTKEIACKYAGRRTAKFLIPDPAYGPTGRYRPKQNEYAMLGAIREAEQMEKNNILAAEWAEEDKRRVAFMLKMGWSEARMAKHERRCQEQKEGMVGWMFGWIYLISVVAVVCYWTLFASQSSPQANKSNEWRVGLSLLAVHPLGPGIIALICTWLHSLYYKNILKLPVFLPRVRPPARSIYQDEATTYTDSKAPTVILSHALPELMKVQRPVKPLYVPRNPPSVDSSEETQEKEVEVSADESQEAAAEAGAQDETAKAQSEEQFMRWREQLAEIEARQREEALQTRENDHPPLVQPPTKQDLSREQPSVSKDYWDDYSSVAAPKVPQTLPKPNSSPEWRQDEADEVIATDTEDRAAVQPEETTLLAATNALELHATQTGLDAASAHRKPTQVERVAFAQKLARELGRPEVFSLPPIAIDSAEIVEDARPATLQGTLDLIAPTDGQEPATKPRKNPARSDSFPKTLDPAPAVEGQRKLRTNYAAVRNPKLREMAIQIHGRNCCVCGFNFDDYFGKELARGYIEVHHLDNIAAGERATDPATDLAPLCANCHAMADWLTLGDESPPRSIAELRKFLLPSASGQEDEQASKTG